MNFFYKYQKIILTILFVIIVISLGYLIYILFFKSSLDPESSKHEPKINTGALPTAETGPGQIASPDENNGLPTKPGEKSSLANPKAQGGLTQVAALNNLPTANLSLSANGSDLQYYNKNDGKFYKINKNGEITILADKIFHNVEKIKWSPDKNKAILEYPDGANIIYDFKNNKQVTLPKHWKDFDFSPNGNQIVAKSMGLDPDNRWLAISNEDGSKARAIEALGEKDATVYPSWSPNNQSIAMYTEGVDFDRQEVFFVGLNHENFKSTIVEGRGFEHQWSPQGNQLLYSVYSSKTDLKPNLWVVNAQGEQIGSGRQNLKLETWSHKCTFANDRDLYCAVPKKLEEGAGLFPDLTQQNSDRLYKIDINTGQKKLIAIPNGEYNVSNIIISDNDHYLYFTDENKNGIYKIRLK